MTRSSPSLSIVRLVLVAGLFCVSAGCKNANYWAWEKLGYEKRDILVSRVKDARDDQEEAKKQFQTTLQRFQEVTNTTVPGDLEAKYKKLNAEYEESVEKAEEVSGRIGKVEEVANDLFNEWQGETTKYTNPELRRTSEQKLAETRTRYQQFLTSMRAAEVKMKPVLAAFSDQVLFLKHNLNAQAIASLETTTIGIQNDVANLIRDMERSIAEANAFISQMK